MDSKLINAFNDKLELSPNSDANGDDVKIAECKSEFSDDGDPSANWFKNAQEFDEWLDETYGFTDRDLKYYDGKTSDEKKYFVCHHWDVDVDEPYEYGVDNDLIIDFEELAERGAANEDDPQDYAGDHDAPFVKEYGCLNGDAMHYFEDDKYLMEKTCDNRFTDDFFESWLEEDVADNVNCEGIYEELFTLRESMRAILEQVPNYNERCIFSYKLVYESEDKSFLSIPIKLSTQLEEYFGSPTITLDEIKENVYTSIKESWDEGDYYKYILGAEPDASSINSVGDIEYYDSDNESDEEEEKERAGLVDILLDSIAHLNEDYLVEAKEQSLFERYPMMDPGDVIENLNESANDMDIDELNDAISLVDSYIEEYESYVDDCIHALGEIKRAEKSLRDIVSYSHWRKFPDQYKEEEYRMYVSDFKRLLGELGLPEERLQSILSFLDFVDNSADEIDTILHQGFNLSPKYDPNCTRELIKSVTEAMDYIGGLISPKRKVGDAEYNRHIKKRRLERKAFDEIRSEQSCEGLVINNTNFVRLVHEIGQYFKTDLCIEADAFLILQYAAEDYLIQLFENANLQAIHCKREIVEINDLHKVMKIRGDRP